MLRMVGEWVKHLYWTENRNGKVVSYSMDPTLIEEIAREMQRLTGVHFKPYHLGFHQFPCPANDPIRKGLQVQTQQVALSDSKGIVEYPRPPFLRSGHPQMGWMIDLGIQHAPERYHYTNERPFWSLPQRIGLADLFFQPWRKSRVLKDGLISGEVAVETGPIGIAIPSDSMVFHTCFEPSPKSSCHKYAKREHQSWELLVSADGRCLTAVLQMFGNIFYAGHMLEDPFWRQTLCSMAACDRAAVNDSATTINKVLDEAFQENHASLEFGSSRLADIVEKLSKKIRLEPRNEPLRTEKDLRDIFGQMKSEALSRDKNDGRWKHYDFKYHVKDDISSMLSSRILLQGCELSCKRCGIPTWHPIGDLASELNCPHCSSSFPAPPSPQWSYKLNALVAEALRRRGMLSLILSIYELEHLNRGLFLFSPCLDIWKRDPRQKIGEIDILALSNGKLILGEAKTDPSGFVDHDLDILAEIADHILPDKIIVSAIGKHWPENVAAKFANLEARLKTVGVPLEKMLLEP